MKTQIKLYVTVGWCEAAAEAVIDICKEFDIPFVDRSNITSMDTQLIEDGKIHVIPYDEGMVLPESYVFFSTNSKVNTLDLPYNILRNKPA